jgi:hypothetical protein
MNTRSIYQSEAPEFVANLLVNSGKIIRVKSYCSGNGSDFYTYDDETRSYKFVTYLYHVTRWSVINFINEHEYEIDDQTKVMLNKLTLSNSFTKKVTFELESKLPLVEFDKDHTVINCTNGLMDFKTGLFRERTTKDYVLKSSGVTFLPDLPKSQIDVFYNTLSGTFPEQKDSQGFIDTFTACLVGHRLYNGVKKPWSIFTHDEVGISTGKSTIKILLKHAFGGYYRDTSLDFLSITRLGCRLLSCHVDLPLTMNYVKLTDSFDFPCWFENYNHRVPTPVIQDSSVIDGDRIIEKINFNNKVQSSDGLLFDRTTFLKIMFENANSYHYIKNICNCSICRNRYVNVNWTKIKFLWLVKNKLDLPTDILFCVCNLYFG